MPECQKIKNGGIDQYGAERFCRLIFAAIKNVGLKGLTKTTESSTSSSMAFTLTAVDEVRCIGRGCYTVSNYTVRRIQRTRHLTLSCSDNIVFEPETV